MGFLFCNARLKPNCLNSRQEFISPVCLHVLLYSYPKRKVVMTNDEVPAEAGSVISFAVAWRNPDNTLVHVDPEINTDNPPEGEPVVICELPPLVAYEVGWALGLYARTLSEINDSDMSQEQVEAAHARGKMMLNLANHIREGVVAANDLLGENWAGEYDFDTKEVKETKDDKQ